MAAPNPAEKKYLTKDEYLVLIEKNHEDFRKKNPEALAAVPNFTPASYLPGIDFVIECREYLDASGNQRFDAAYERYMGKGTEGADEAGFDEGRAECMALLEGRPDLQKKWDEIYGKEHWVKVQEMMRYAREAGKTEISSA